KVGVSWGRASFALSVQYWINDLLMVVFFFVVGLEIKRELVVGQLSTAKRAALPVMAAIGGMVVPALLYTMLNGGSEGAPGWGIPMATDIAFALGVLAVFGARVPIGLKVFLTALAIVDDLGAVLVIALFYTAQINLIALAAAAVFLLLIAIANRAGLTHPVIYVALAFGVWAGILGSGVHATVAGVLVALLVPIRARRDPQEFLAVSDGRLAELRAVRLTQDSMIEDRSQLDAISDLYRAAGGMRPPGLVLEEVFHPFVVFVILPLFALFNAGVAIDGSIIVDSLRHPVSLGITIGLVLGKQLGIALFSWIAVRSGRADLPQGVRWSHIYGGACLAGIGFTMSLFVTELAFSDIATLGRAKVGILTASVVAALWGAVVLQLGLRRPRASTGRNRA
ncbi:MAG: Na+/H+ antiporter NhaA, partial [Acidobacteria bacterium]|nr:Na+/H+ antiporter NhaA [Acidobacteriota bacterium]